MNILAPKSPRRMRWKAKTRDKKAANLAKIFHIKKRRV